MREIKFRQFINGKFHYWGLISEGVFHGMARYEDGCPESQQFTGLLDKKGKEIYEGDILIRIVNGREYGENYIVDKIIPLNKLLWSDCYSFSEEYEVIGNIYENPELIK